MRKTILGLFFALLLASSSWAATPAVSVVSGTLFDASGNARPNTTVIFNMPQQVIGGTTITAQVLSSRTDSAGALTPIQLPQNAIVSIAVGSGMPVTGCVPLTTTADIAVVLTCTLSAVSPGGGGAVQINGVGIQSQTTLNFINGTNIVVTNPSAGNIQHSINGQIGVANGGTGVSSLTAHGVLVGEGTSPVQVTTAGTLGQCLMSNGASSDPTFQTCPGTAGAGITSLNSQTGPSQTFANDTNVTITSGSNVHQLGWTGQLAVSRGGTGDSTLTNHGVLIGQATSPVAVTSAGTAGQVLTSNGASADPTFQSVGGSTVVIKTINEGITSDTTLQNDDELFLNVGANETWVVKLVIFYVSAANNTGNISIGILGPVGMTGTMGAVGKSLADSTGMGQSAVNLERTSIGNCCQLNYQATTTEAMIVMEVLVLNSSNPGNVFFAWAQNSNSSDQTLVAAGSYLVATRM